MNAVRALAGALPRVALVRMLGLAQTRRSLAPTWNATGPGDGVDAPSGDSAEDRASAAGRLFEATTQQLRERVVDRFALDLAAFLSAARRRDLDRMAAAAGLDPGGDVASLRVRLWLWGAEREAGGRAHLGSALQPLPIVLGDALAPQGPVRGLAPPATALPRPVPLPRPAPDCPPEPESLTDLLAAADDLIGVRLGRRHRNKGAFGARVAALLGVPERGQRAPDWRAEVEIKTVPVVRDRSGFWPGFWPGFWRVAEDPCLGMAGAAAVEKLGRVLWIPRVADMDDSVVLSWYYQECDAEVARLASRHMHLRPKGGRGAATRGVYLYKRFFLESGLSRSLNG